MRWWGNNKTCKEGHVSSEGKQQQLRELLMKSRFACRFGLVPRDKGKGSLGERIFPKQTWETYGHHELALCPILNVIITRVR